MGAFIFLIAFVLLFIWILYKIVRWIIDLFAYPGRIRDERTGRVVKISRQAVHSIKTSGAHYETHERNLIEEERIKILVLKYGELSVEEVLFNKEIEKQDKLYLLKEVQGYPSEEAMELVETAIKEEKRAKLKEVKRKISLKAKKLYNDVPVDDKRIRLTDEVKAFVWNRDEGRCVKCGSQEKLEFDHIIPFSKGGSSTARNIQLLCEKCNREKSDKI